MVNRRPTTSKIKGMGKQKALENLDRGKEQKVDAGNADTATILKISTEGVEKVNVKVVKPGEKQDS